MPPASRLLRLLAFAVPAALALAGAQPLLGAASGEVGGAWAISLSAPALAAAAVVFLSGRLGDRGDIVQPPWFSAWLLLPGAFLLAGAAAMCIYGALIEFPSIPLMMWTLLVAGATLWAGGILIVRKTSR